MIGGNQKRHHDIRAAAAGVATVEALLSHTPPSHEKCMGYEGLWEDRERLHARLAGISVPNVMKGINGQSKGIGKSLGMS